MASRIYIILAVISSLISTIGAPIIASVIRSDESISNATWEQLNLVISYPFELLFFLVPFFAIAAVSAKLGQSIEGQSAPFIFSLGMLALIYVYYDGHFAALEAMDAERWTAAALTLGFMPIFGGGLVGLFVIGALSLVIVWQERKAGRP